MRNATGIGAALFFLMGTTLAVAAELPRAEPIEVGLSQERLDKITAVLEGDVARKTLAGDVLLIARHGKVAYFEGVGARDPQAKAPMSRGRDFPHLFDEQADHRRSRVMMLVEDGQVHARRSDRQVHAAFEDMKVGVETADPAGGKPNVMQLVPTRRSRSPCRT